MIDNQLSIIRDIPMEWKEKMAPRRRVSIFSSNFNILFCLLFDVSF